MEENKSSKYAQVIVDVPNLDMRTFSYLIPEEISSYIKIGQPVLVPFGNQGAVNAYIVGFSDYLPEGIKAKSVYEILDKEPVFDLQYLQFLEWISNYYCCDLPTTIAAAIPVNFFSKTKRIIALTGQQYQNLKTNQQKNGDVLTEKCDTNLQIKGCSSNGVRCSGETPTQSILPLLEEGLGGGVKTFVLNTNQQKVVDILLERSEISVSFLQKKSKLPPSKFYEAVRALRNQNIVEIKNIIEEKSQKAKTERYIKLLDKTLSHAELVSASPLNKRQQEIITALDILGGYCKFSEFLTHAKTTSNTIKKLQDTGNIEIIDEEVYRDPLKVFDIDEDNKEKFLKLNFDQQQALERISKSVDEKDSKPLLLYGVTGSGKTEVYFHAAKAVLDKGRTVIFLAPEIALASQLIKRVAQRFGSDKVAIWHSNISEGERYDVWNKIRNNEIKIIVGARSAIFAPIKNVGLIIIDEEHESSYKQTSPSPRYNAKTLAFERAKRENSSLVLGSATPDVTTYYRALNTNRVLFLPERFGSKDMAKVTILDMKQESNRGNRSIFSVMLRKSIEENIKDKMQSILLINRRGFSTHIICNNCGYVAECKKCSIPLILHRPKNVLRCHYCNYEEEILSICPECGDTVINYYGLGTQKVEEELRKIFPEANIARLDSDIMAKKNAHIEILDDFSQGKIDVLIGTQMIAKGLDNPNVTLVGVLSSDSLFTLPDFRASERGFQLLTQVAGRAGRGDFKGKVYFQTYNPEFFALQNAKQQDYLSFYYSEIQSRSEYSYPPYSQIIRMIFSSKNEIRTKKYADDIAYKLNLLTDSRGITEKLEVLGPTPCVISKIKDEFRFQIIIKNRLEENGHMLITSFIKKLKFPEDLKFLIDIDPSDML